MNLHHQKKRTQIIAIKIRKWKKIQRLWTLEQSMKK